MKYQCSNLTPSESKLAANHYAIMAPLRLCEFPITALFVVKWIFALIVKKHAIFGVNLGEPRILIV